MACPCCCPCKSNDQMPCGYTWPTLNITIRVAKGERYRPPGLPNSFLDRDLPYKFSASSYSKSVTPLAVYNPDGSFFTWFATSDPDFTTSEGRTIFEIENPLTGAIGLFSRRTVGFVPPSTDVTRGVGGGSGAFAGPLTIANSGWTEFTGFDFDDWYWLCDKWVIGSFTRSQPLVIPETQIFHQGVLYPVPGLTMTGSISVTV